MSRSLFTAALMAVLGATSATAQRVPCTPEEIDADRWWSTKVCEGGTRDITPPKAAAAKPAALNKINPPVPRKADVGVPEWRAEMDRSFRLIVKSVELGDIEEMKRQSLALAKRSREVLDWPDIDQWTRAQIQCSRMATTLMSFSDYKLQISARGELNAESALNDYVDARKQCFRALAKLK